MKKIYFIIGVIIWLFISLIGSLFLSQFLYNKFFSDISIDTSDPTNIFVVLFTIFGAGITFLFSWFQFSVSQKEKLNNETKENAMNFALLKPLPLQQTLFFGKDGDSNNFLSDLQMSFFEKEKCIEDFLGKSIYIQKDYLFIEFFLVKTIFEGLFKLVSYFEPAKHGQKRVLFTLVNEGRTYARPKLLRILCEKEKRASRIEKYIDKDCVPPEFLSNYPTMFPFKDIVWIFADNKKYKTFIKEKSLEEFIVIIEYISMPTNKLIKLAYKANLTDVIINESGETRKVISSFDVIPKHTLKEEIHPSKLLDDLMTYPMFD